MFAFKLKRPQTLIIYVFFPAWCFYLLFSLFSFLPSQLVWSIHTVSSWSNSDYYLCTWVPSVIVSAIQYISSHFIIFFLFVSSISSRSLLLLFKLITQSQSHLSFTFNQALLIKDNLNAAQQMWRMRWNCSRTENNEALIHLSISGERGSDTERESWNKRDTWDTEEETKRRKIK